MGKTYKSQERQNNKYSKRDMSRKLKEQQLRATFSTENEASKPKPKKKWKPHSEIDDN